MMRVLISLFLVAAFMGCDSGRKKEKPTHNQPVLKTDDGSIREFVLNTGPHDTDHTFTYDYELPKGFYFDTITFNDTARGFYANAYSIVSNDNEFAYYSNKLAAFLWKYFLYEQSFLDGSEIENDPYFRFDVEIGPHQLFMNENVISMCFMVDSYSTGGNHHNYHFLTFNYDRKSKKQIRFSEVFPMKTKSDTLDLINHLNWKIEYDNLPEQYDSLDFAFTKQGVCFHTYWRMQQALLDMDSISKYNIKAYYKD